MKILMLSTDPRILEEGSAVSLRLCAYGALTDGITVLVSSGALSERREVSLSREVTLIAVPPSPRVLRPLALIRAGFALRREGFSLITAQDPFETGFAGAVLSLLLSVPLEVQVHTDFLSPFFSRHSFLNRMRVALAGFILPRARAVRVVSERIKRSLVERYRIPAQRITVLPILNSPREAPASPVRLKERFPQFSSFSVAVSRLESEKNVGALLEAFAAVVRTEKDAALMILGDGRERGALVAHTLELGIDKNVIFDGWQDPLPYLAEADLFVQNSLYEGYGLTLVEAAQAGCPILTTDVGIVGEVITEENAAIVAPGDTPAFARAWQTALENPQFMREKAERAAEAVREHMALSPEAYAERIVGLWEKACAKSV
ncbi:MAG TPA: glycosyltransferase family 4 protein [Candidatus Paceibacterota bacterium]|nr:glycosyltransferase family 4 protein [Candidatus Paceibacterota bacterium]